MRSRTGNERSLLRDKASRRATNMLQTSSQIVKQDTRLPCVGFVIIIEKNKNKNKNKIFYK